MILGLTGRAGAGKDFTYHRLHEMGYAVKRFAFADGLREEIQNTLGGYYLSPLWEKPYPQQVRKLLQWWGVDRRDGDPDYWVNVLGNQMPPFAKGGQLETHLAIITDLRFPNEVDMVKRMGGTVGRVWAPEKTRLERLGELPPDHISETALDKFEVDFTLESTHGHVTPYGPRDLGKWKALLQNVAKTGL